MTFISSIVIALPIWALFSWVCGRTLGHVIALMQGEDEPDESWPGVSI